MSSKKNRTAPAGLDYAPVMGDTRTVSFGVIQTRLVAPDCADHGLQGNRSCDPRHYPPI